MARFSFRLSKVLEYRQMQEEWARDSYLAAQAQRMAGDAVLAHIIDRRQDALAHPVLALEDRIALERLLLRIDEEEHEQRLALQVLMEEEAKAFVNWTEKRRDREALSKLREKAYEEWTLEEGRKEQAELDEWAVLRRAA